MKSEIINGLIPMLSDKTGRVPIILPIVMGINSDNDESSTEENNKVKQ